MKDFLDFIEQLSRRHGFMSVFDDFLTAAVAAFSMGRAEKEYEDAMRRYNEEEKPLFGKALGAIIMAYEKESSVDGGWADPLGHFFEEHNSKFGASAAGQFFTPVHVCDLMAKVTAGDYEEKELKINDPACGSGRNLIAFDRTDSRNRLKNFYIGQDIDTRCVKMCALNMFFFGLKGVVIHMDSIRLEIYKGFRLWLPETGLGIQPLTSDECRRYVFAEKQSGESTGPVIINAPQAAAAQQLNLF